MFCTNCGNQLIDGARFCIRCGTAIPTAAPQQPQPQQPQYQYQQPQYQQTMIQTAVLGMGWFKFLIYFGLFAGAVLNAISGILFLTGAAYGGDARIIYRYFDGLQTLDIIVGICTLATAALGIYARFRLAGYHKNGPKMLYAVYAAAAAVQLVYVIGIYAVLPSRALDVISFGPVYVSIAVGIVMVCVNVIYFKKRAHLFVNN